MNRLPAFDRTVSRRSSTSIWTALLLAAFVGVVGLVQPVSVVQAAPRLTLVVDRTDDPDPPLVVCAGFANDCSLRGAIITANANPGSTIVLTHGATYTLTIPASGSDDATTGDLNITASTTFNFGSSI